MNNEEKVRHTFDGMEPVVKSVSVKKPQSFIGERPLTAIEMAPRVLRYQSRRDFLVFGAGALAALAGAGFVLPQQTLSRMGMPRNMDSPGKERFLNKALRIDDDVAEALYSGTRRVPTYTKSQITSLKNNYNGATPDPSYITGWNLTLSGLASGLSISLDIRNLLTRFSVHEQITRLVCVEGWSGIAWWAGLKFDDLLRAYPPMSQAKWARVESSVNLDASGNPDPYFMSLDLGTARHPQTLLATHFNGQPLTVEHGAPLRLLVPVKLGLKNVRPLPGLGMSRKSQETIGPNVDIPATTEFDASSLSLQQDSVRREPIRFSTSSSHPAHFLRRTQSLPPSQISTVRKRRRHALVGCSLPVAPYVARVPMRMAGATGLEPAASCVTGRHLTN